MRPDQKMGEGNYPLAGHHLKQKNLLFGPLENIKTGGNNNPPVRYIAL